LGAKEHAKDMTKAVYLGSFDPPTNGHMAVIDRAVKIFSRLIVAVAENPQKKYLFTRDERVQMLKTVLRGYKNIKVDSFTGLAVSYLKRRKVDVILRGIRTSQDMEYEYQMAFTNSSLLEGVDTLFIMPSPQYSFISSSLVKEVASLGGDISQFVPQEIIEFIKKKF
jgi:pantetheine-phosphate adenylyltransferase